ncbi:haloacid dehalogenase, type II [Chloroherpeton thalassium ATCC 35110]|uniref:Haloacid dehalogenase, type II n=1 Tax=Chloroherpeton thalassium (strain ATCC 35110 / GB-78) TaxID=517418 RepID=B3QY07_CHLT3|nr:haloacid dehalogenase type II [Chloroherpeton thalassium]ACF13535.1 haloacid dehalogenase, type II [Chloroherpeton thalassium ATCC 35110]
MALTLAFDVYGTLIDTTSVVAALTQHLGDEAVAFSHFWREKQLEYSFRRGLMQNYQNFNLCTRQALEAASNHFKAPLSEATKDALMEAYKQLPAFPEAKQGLTTLDAIGARMFAFSNGLTEDVSQLLAGAGILGYFQDVISVDEIRTYKPNPAVYCHFLRRTKSRNTETWLISSNPFDVIGAISAGLLSVWVKRSPDITFDPWEIQPTLVVENLTQLEETIANYIQ